MLDSEATVHLATKLIVLTAPVLAAGLVRRYDEGLAAAVLMTGFAGACFFLSVRRSLRPAPPVDPAVIEARRRRRRGRTAFWRNHILWLAEHDRGPQGERARAIKRTWDEAEEAQKQKPRS